MFEKSMNLQRLVSISEMKSGQAVIPAQERIQIAALDSRLRGNDGSRESSVNNARVPSMLRLPKNRLYLSPAVLMLTLVCCGGSTAAPPLSQVAVPTAGATLLSAQNPATSSTADDVLRDENLVAWCIVPFDQAKRGPAERALMLKEMGITRCAYDWRQEHVPTFEQEILEYKKQGIEYFAFWSTHDDALALFQKYDLHPQIWQMIGGDTGTTDAEKTENAANAMTALAKRTAELKCPLGLYNHGGWTGEPRNLVAVCRRLREMGFPHVGIVYNFHHGHDHIADWKESFDLMKPYLLCLNLNGMNDGAQPKILGIGKGQHELEMIRVVTESDYRGPIGIIDHREELDARESLQENLDGLRWVRKELQQPGSGGPAPQKKN
jgi:hypothetical protein